MSLMPWPTHFIPNTTSLVSPIIRACSNRSMTASELALLLANGETQTDWNTTLEKLRVGNKTTEIDTWKKQYEVAGHDVMNTAKRPDQVLENGGTETVNRVGLAFQRLITARAVAFLFGKQVILSSKPKGTEEEQVYEAVQKILKAAKIHSHNKELALDLFRATEVAECWYPVEGE
ncbi:MAG: phage portal protein, partial [Cytophagaceae bacterium]